MGNPFRMLKTTGPSRGLEGVRRYGVELGSLFWVSLTFNLANAQPAWVEQGPGPISVAYGEYPWPLEDGAIESVVIDPSNPDRIFVASVNGGVWRTFNGTSGAPTWTPLTDYLPSLSISAIAFDPQDVSLNTLYAGFGNLSAKQPFGGSPTPGLIKTTDGGDTWVSYAQSTFAATKIRSILPTTFNDRITGKQVVLVAAQGSGGGIFRSADAGSTFPAAVLGGAQGATAVVADPSNNLRYYAGVPGAGIFRSEDGGNTWADVIALANSSRIVLSVSPAVEDGLNPVYALVAEGPPADVNVTEVLRSIDLGNTWTDLAPLPSGLSDGSADYHASLLADEFNNDVAFLGGAQGPIYRWNGGSWDELPQGEHVDSRGMAFDAMGDLLECDDGGIYRLHNPDRNDRLWSSLVGNIRVTEMISIAYDPISHNLVGTSQDNGDMSQSSRDGYAAVEVGLGGDGLDVGVDSTSMLPYTLHYYSKIGDPGLWRSRYDSNGTRVDLQALQRVVNGSGGQTVDSGLFILNAVDPTKMLVSFAAALYESTSSLPGDAFDELGPVGPIRYNSWAYGGNSAGAPNPSVIYLGSGTSLAVRINGGGPPVPVGAPYPGGTIEAIVLDPNEWHQAFVGDITGRVWRTTDAGATSAGWSDLTGNLGTNGGDLRNLQAVPIANQLAVVVAGRYGVFFAINPAPGASPYWTRLGNNLPNLVVSDLRYNAADDVLVASTFGRSAWKMSDVARNCAASVVAPVLYVDRSATGANPDGTPINPFHNVSAAYNVAQNCDRLLITTGTYQETLPFALSKNLRLEANGGTVTIGR